MIRKFTLDILVVVSLSFAEMFHRGYFEKYGSFGQAQCFL